MMGTSENEVERGGRTHATPMTENGGAAGGSPNSKFSALENVELGPEVKLKLL